jgi:hypothetical protein
LKKNRQIKAADPPIPKQHRHHIHLRGPILYVTLAVLLFPWIPLFNAGYHSIGMAITRAHRHTKAGAPAVSMQQSIEVGAWGTLEITPIVIQPPATYFSENYDMSGSKRWRFRGATPDQVKAIFESAGLSPPQCSALMKATWLEITQTGCITDPPDDILWRLSPQQRSALYAAIAGFPDNIMQEAPFRYRCSSPDEWLKDCPLPGPTLAKIRQLIYTRNTNQCFSDVHLIAPLLHTAEERILFQRLLENEAHSVLHTCIYIADGIVFTKNGMFPQYPFKFDKLADVKCNYSFGGPLHVKLLRRTVGNTHTISDQAAVALR